MLKDKFAVFFLIIMMTLSSIPCSTIPLRAVSRSEVESDSSFGGISDPVFSESSGSDLSDLPPSLPASSRESAGESSTDDRVPDFVPGIVPEEIEMDYPDTMEKDSGGDKKESGKSSNRKEFRANSTLPSRYPTDGDYSKYATAVKNQGVNGLCWDFAATAMMETWLKHAQKKSNQYQGDYDFSEAHMSYAMSNRNNNVFGEDRDPGGDNSGGNRGTASAYLMRGMPEAQYGPMCVGGTVPENEDPFGDPYSILPYRDPGITFYYRSKNAMPVNIYDIAGRKQTVFDESLNTMIKEAVMDHGSVSASYEAGSNDGTYNESTAAIYRSPAYKGQATNHSVLIIGWDDNYPASNFAMRPPGNGAWRIKNSWGTNWGDKGYGWISYYDAWFPDAPYTIDGVKAYDKNTMYIYEYDYTNSENSRAPGDMYLRYFSARKDEAVTQIMVHLASSDANVEVDVIPDLDAVNMGQYSFTSMGAVKSHYPGWYTITLKQPVLIREGKLFAAVVKTKSALALDKDSDYYGDYHDSSGWHMNNAAYKGFCIKAETSSDQDTINLLKCMEYLNNDTNFWNTIRGANTSPDALKYDLTAPAAGKGPYGTTIEYTDISTSSIMSADGSIHRPSYGNAAAPVTFTIKFKRGNQWFSRNNVRLIVAPYKGKLTPGALPAYAHRGSSIKATVTSQGNPGTLKYQWQRKLTSGEKPEAVANGVSDTLTIPDQQSNDFIYYCQVSSEDAESVVVGYTATSAGNGPEAHSFDQLVRKDSYLKSAATCTIPALYYKSCRCELAGTDTFTYGEPAGHSFGEWKVTSSGCTASGFKERVCKSCGIIETENLDPKDHEWENTATIDITPGCETDGSQSIHCRNCSAKKDSEALPATGHDWSSISTVDKEPTCTKDGSRSCHCRKCDKKKDTESIPALGHNWAAAAVDKVATCTEDGNSSIRCTRCRTVKEGSVKVIKKTGHNYGAWTVTRKATKKAEGEEQRSCSRCGHIEKRSIAKLSSSSESQTGDDEILDLPAVKLLTPKASKKAMTVKWKKLSKKKRKKIQGIEVQYSNDGFYKSVKTKKIGKTKTSLKIKKLKSKKIYWVRVRTYKNASDGKHISEWKIKSVMIK